jgi:hypothetical protein
MMLSLSRPAGVGMRALFAAAAWAIAAPAVHAQPFLGGVANFRGGACFDGIVDLGDPPGSAIVYGTVACYTATARVGEIMFDPGFGGGPRPWTAIEVVFDEALRNVPWVHLSKFGGEWLATTPSGTVQVFMSGLNPVFGLRPVFSSPADPFAPVVAPGDVQALSVIVHSDYLPLNPDVNPGSLISFSLNVHLTPVPEPATIALTAGGLLALAGVARRRRTESRRA